MAFPATLSTLVNPYHGVGGPFVSSGDNVYVVTRSSDGSSIQIFKASDPASSWAGISSLAVTSGNTIRAIAAYQVSDILHIVTRDAAAANSNQIRYHTFNMAADAFVTSNQLVKTTYTQKGAVDDSMVGIVVRGDGNKIILYEGPQVLADVQRARTYYARHMGAAWSADISIDNAGNVDWYPAQIILGAADRVHFILLDATTTGYHQRTITSANVAESFPAAFYTAVPGYLDLAMQQGVAYSASAGVVNVRCPVFNDIASPGIAINEITFDSNDAPTIFYDPDITAPVTAGGALRRTIAYAKDDDNCYAAFVGQTNLYHMTSVHGASFDAPVLLHAASAASVFANVYVRNLSKVLAVIYHDQSTNLNYTEYTLSTGASTVQPFRMALTGIGR